MRNPPSSCDRRAYIAYRRGLLSGGETRNYPLETACYHNRPVQRRRRLDRQRLRARWTREGRVQRNDGTEIHHRNHDTTDERPWNLQLLTAAAHRALHRLEARRRH